MAAILPSIVVRDLSCERGGVEIFSGVDFELTSGQCGCLRGDNGAGKSTLLRVVAGLLEPTSGSVAVEPAAERARHVTLGDAALKPDLLVQDQLAYEAEVMGVAERLDALRMVGLGHAGGLPGRALSTGQRRRFVLARLILDERPVWCLDEPTSGLDADGRALFADLLSDHLDAGGVALLATHETLDIPGERLVSLLLGSAGS